MKKYAIFSIAAIATIVFAASAHAVIDNTASASMSATVTGATSLSIAPTSATFGTTNVDAFPTVPADKKLVLTYASNYNPWKICVYTNNIQVPNFGQPDGRYQKGGLATADGKNLVPCKWIAKVGTTTAPPPAVPTPTTYNFVKDKRDEDDPATTGSDESWATAFAAGYANIAYGGIGYGYCVDPQNPPTYQGDAITPASGIAVYVAGMFQTGGVTPSVPAAAGTYSSSVYFDLYHE